MVGGGGSEGEEMRWRERDGGLRRRGRKKRNRAEGEICFGRVNNLGLVPVVQKVTANVSVCLWDLRLPTCLYVHACLCQCLFNCVLLPLLYFQNNGCGGQGIYLWELQSTITLFSALCCNPRTV